MIKGRVFINEATPSADDTVYERCNMMSTTVSESAGQKVGVRIFPGDDTPRTFIDCNLINRIVPPGSTVTGCNTAIIEYAVVTGSDQVVIDGETITMDTTVNRVHGHYANGVAVYKTTPEDIENG